MNSGKETQDVILVTINWYRTRTPEIASHGCDDLAPLAPTTRLRTVAVTRFARRSSYIRNLTKAGAFTPLQLAPSSLLPRRTFPQAHLPFLLLHSQLHRSARSHTIQPHTLTSS